MELSQVVNPGFIRPWHYLVRVPQPWDQVMKIFSWTGWLTDWILKWEYFCVECSVPAWLAEQSQAGQVWLGGSPQLTQCRKDLLINLIFELSPPHHHHHPLHHQQQILVWSCGLMLCRNQYKLFLSVTLAVLLQQISGMESLTAN